jgi:O-antigen/teichoic acid export membrane protein
VIKKLFTHTFLYAIGPQVPKLANLLVLPVITQYLTPLDYGVYGTLLAYSALMGGVKKLGFDVLLVNAFYKKNTWKRHWSRYLGGLYIFNFFFSFLYFFILYTLMPEEVIEHKVLVVSLIVVPATLFDIIKMFGGRYFQLSQKPQYIAITTAITGGITVMLNLYTIAHLKLGYLGWIFSTAIGSFMVFIFYAIPLFKTLRLKMEFTMNWKFWKKSLKVSLPTVPHQYASYLLNSSDRLVMDQLQVPIGQIGIYNLAYILGGYMEIFGQAINMAVAPMVTSLYAKKTDEAEKQVQQLIFFLTVIFILICSTMALWAKEIFQLLIHNDNLSVAYPIAIIIIMGYAYRPIKIGGMNKLFFYEHTKKLWRISFVAGILNVVLNLIFIPLYGIYAAAVTTFFSLYYMAISPYYIKEYRQMKNERFYAEYWMLGILFLTGAIYSLKAIAIFYKLIITACFVAIFLVYFFKKKKVLSQINLG